MLTTANGAPKLGSTGFALGVQGAPAHAPGLLLLGSRLTYARLSGGCNLYPDLSGPFVLAPLWTDGNGKATVACPVPLDRKRPTRFLASDGIRVAV